MDFVLVLSVLLGLTYLSAELMKGEQARQVMAILFARREKVTVSATSWGYMLSRHTSSHSMSSHSTSSHLNPSHLHR